MTTHPFARLSKAPLPECFLLALAALVRFWRLDYHSFWFDEIVSLDWAGRTPGEIWDVGFHLVQEKHPPGYYLTLHLWQKFLGVLGLAQNDSALRALGSLLGVATVLGLLLLVTRLSSRRAGLVTALFVTLSPVLVWYSQELRMFQPAATGLVWALCFLVMAATGPDGERGVKQSLLRIANWAGVVVTLTYTLYSYLFAAFFLPGLGLALLVLAGRRWRVLAEGCIALGIVGLLFLPLARNAWLVNDAENLPATAFGGFATILWRQLQIFTLWRAEWSGWALTGALLLFCLLILAGLFARPSSGKPVNLLLALWIGLPLLIAGLLQATNASIFKEDRYHIYLAPFVLWAAGEGVVALARWRPWLGWGSGGLAALLLAAALPLLWTPGALREDWRAATAYIADYQAQSPGLTAGGVAHLGYLRPAVLWYLDQRIPTPGLPVFGLFGGRLTEDQMDSVIGPPLAGIESVMGAHTLWLLQSHLEGVDDEKLVERWLDERHPLITEQFPAGIKLSGYALGSRYAALPPLAVNARYPQVIIAPAIEMAACEVVTPQVTAQESRLHPPSGWVHLRAWLRAKEVVATDLQPYARLVGAGGVWGELLPRPNGVLERFPTSTWTPGEFMRVEMDINLNPLTPGGRYEAVVGFEGAAEAVCGFVEVTEK